MPTPSCLQSARVARSSEGTRRAGRRGFGSVGLAVVVASCAAGASAAGPDAGAQADAFRLPFQGRWFVLQGGDTPNVNHHMAVRAQWYGVDFGKVGGASGRALSSKANPTRPEDFYCWNEPVLAPAAGEVLSVVEDRADNALGTRDTAHPRGNHVVIRAAEDRYVVLAHFRRGSVVVEPGARVERGQLLARCGNSGNSDFPHIHLHVQDARTADAANGLNPVFGGIDVELTGKTFTDVTWPVVRGLFVRPSR